MRKTQYKNNDWSVSRLSNEIQKRITDLNIKTGDDITYKNEICTILNVEYSSQPNTKKSHMKTIQQFMKLEKIGTGRGTKFLVVEIYDEVQEREDNRGKSENSQQAIKKHNEENAVFTGEDLEKLNDSVSCVAIKHHLEEFDVTLEDYLGVSEMYRQREQGRQQIQAQRFINRHNFFSYGKPSLQYEIANNYNDLPLSEETLNAMREWNKPMEEDVYKEEEDDIPLYERLESFLKAQTCLVRQEIQIENEFGLSDDEERLCTTNEMILPMKKSLVEVGLCNQYREQLDSHKNHYSTNNPNGYHDWAWCL